MMKHSDKLFLGPLIDWQINYVENYFDLDSSFMKKYVHMCEDRYGSGYWDTADYVVQLLNFDKVEKLPLTITTARINIYETFYNYLLMGVNIVKIPSVVYNQQLGDFCYYQPSDFITTSKEQEFEEEIKLIKKYIPLQERPQYFK